MSLPTDSAKRKQTPVYSGVLAYFPDAIAEVARVSWVGNEQHNPGEPLHWAREKSTDHPDCIARHLLERGKIDTDGTRHSAKLAWRALAMLQLELEAARRTEQPKRRMHGLYCWDWDNKSGLQLRPSIHDWQPECDYPPQCEEVKGG